MSTLATNKLGTLSGSADISLPTTRPSGTLAGRLDSAGNLSFASASSNVDNIVSAKNNKVGVVLFDEVACGLQSDAVETQDVTSGSAIVKGFSVGIHNASDFNRTNYLFNGNIRQIEIDFCFYNNKSSTSGSGNGGMTDNTYFTPLDTSGKKLWKTTQQNCTYAKTYEDEGSSATQSKQGAPDEAFGPTNNPGFFSARNGNYPGTSTFGKVYWLCGVNSTWQAFYYITKLRQNRSSGDMYPTLQSGYVMTSTAQTNNARSQTGGNNSQGYGQPWEMMGGIAFNGGGSTGSPFDMFHAQAYAYIKPTTLVST
jgi:hypothetical protein